MPRTADATTEAPDQSGASSIPADIDPADIRSLISDLTAEVKSLRQQVRDQDNRMPVFQPNQTKSDYANYFEGMVKGQPFERAGDRRFVIGTDSHPLSDAELRRNPPQFAANDYVRLNLEAPAHGSERTWDDVVEGLNERQRKARKRLPSVVGRVVYISYRRDDGSYKYRVIFPGLTGLVPDKDRGDGFDEDELLPFGGQG